MTQRNGEIGRGECLGIIEGWEIGNSVARRIALLLRRKKAFNIADPFQTK